MSDDQSPGQKAPWEGQPYSVKRHGVTITNCDSEPIQTPGCIQAHGALLVLRLDRPHDPPGEREHRPTTRTPPGGAARPAGLGSHRNPRPSPAQGDPGQGTLRPQPPLRRYPPAPWRHHVARHDRSHD